MPTGSSGEGTLCISIAPGVDKNKIYIDSIVTQECPLSEHFISSSLTKSTESPYLAQIDSDGKVL